MIDLISYWVLVTLCTLLLLSSVSPIIIVVGNHAASFVSRGKLSSTWFSNKLIRFLRLHIIMPSTLEHNTPGWGKADTDARWYFGTGLSASICGLSGGMWLISLVAYGEGAHTYDLVGDVHGLAYALAPHVSYVTVGLGGYALMLFGARAVFGLQQKLKRLMENSND